MGQNVPVSQSGKRAGPKRKRGVRPALLLLAVGVTAAVVAWGYLVKAAIDFGSTARGGDQDAWMFLAFASLGAVACLFVGLMLVARILRRLGITNPASASSSEAPSPSTAPDSPRPTRPVGGHRAKH
jgi:hypothetical protein